MSDIQRFVFIASTKEASVNGEKYKIDIEKIEPSNLRAIQWYGNTESPWGEFEFDGENNRQFFEFSLIHALYEKWVNAKATFQKENEETLARIEKEKLIEEGKYDYLRRMEYPLIEDQVGALMKIVSKLIENNGLKNSNKEDIVEFESLVNKIQEIKDKYPKDVVEKKTSKKKNK